MSASTLDRRRANTEELRVEEQVLVEQVNRIRKARDQQESRVILLITEAQERNRKAREVMESALRLSSMEGEALDELRRITFRLAGAPVAFA